MVGGLFRILDEPSKASLGDPKAKRWYYQLCWGTVSRAPQMTMREKDNVPCVRFSVCWRRNQFVNYWCYADNPFAYEIAQKLRLGDPVIVCSHGSERDYVPKKGHNVGKLRVSREGKVHIIFPMRLMAGVLAAMQEATEMPDILEGLDEYLRQQATEGGKDADYEMPF